MKIEVTIGSTAPAKIILPDESVSLSHAVLFYEDNQYIIKDNQSKNGVYVNGNRVRQYLLSPSDQLKFGNVEISYANLLEQAEPELIKHRTDFTPEYLSLIEPMKAYDVAKKKINDPPFLPILITSGLSILGLLTITFKPFPMGQPIGLLIVVGVIASVIRHFVMTKSKKQQKLDNLKLKYESVLRCPKCKASLLNQSATLLMGRTHCFNTKCDATYQTNPIHTGKNAIDTQMRMA